MQELRRRLSQFRISEIEKAQKELDELYSKK
jgi:hypothetical protein